MNGLGVVGKYTGQFGRAEHYYQQGRPDDAARAYRRALTIFRRHLPERHPSIRTGLEAQAALTGP